MQVIIHGQQKYIQVTTVTLQKSDNNQTFPYHCNSCGNTLCVIGGEVVKIYPILEPSNQIPVIQTCKSCKAKYVFQDSSMRAPIINVRVLLKPIETVQAFYCYLGGGEQKYLNKILEYKTGSLYSPTFQKHVHLPYITRCGNPLCKLSYEFTQL